MDNDMDYNGLSKFFLGTIFLHIIDDFLKWSNSIRSSNMAKSEEKNYS